MLYHIGGQDTQTWFLWQKQGTFWHFVSQFFGSVWEIFGEECFGKHREWWFYEFQCFWANCRWTEKKTVGQCGILWLIIAQKIFPQHGELETMVRLCICVKSIISSGSSFKICLEIPFNAAVNHILRHVRKNYTNTREKSRGLWSEFIKWDSMSRMNEWEIRKTTTFHRNLKLIYNIENHIYSSFTTTKTTL